MEDNLDSIKESSKKGDNPMNKDIINIDNPKETSSLTNKNSTDPNKEILGDEITKNIIKDPNNKKIDSENSNKVINENNKKNVGDENPKALKIKPKKDLPIEKKPFNEFINDHLLPSIIQEFKLKGFEVTDVFYLTINNPTLVSCNWSRGVFKINVIYFKSFFFEFINNGW